VRPGGEDGTRSRRSPAVRSRGVRRVAAPRPAEVRVHYGALRTSWGRVWAALGPDGVVRVALGPEPVGKLVEEVRTRHPARLVHDLARVEPLLDDLGDFLDGRRHELDWPSDYGGLGAFARAVYEAARRVP